MLKGSASHDDTTEVQITSNGIKRTLNAYNAERAIAEFIWNGFDANASKVSVSVTGKKDGFFELTDELIIQDNGDGIPFEQLGDKFRPFMESQKEAARTKKYRESKIQGSEGKGRLTFFKFCRNARWETVYRNGRTKYAYYIAIESDSLEVYAKSQPEETALPVGTRVIFTQLIPEINSFFVEKTLSKSLSVEFGWYLELNKNRKFQILLGDHALDWSSLIADQESFAVCHAPTQTQFDVRYLRWNEYLPEYSRFYYLNANHVEQFKEPTTFNNKGDGFYHSLYVTSDYFRDFTASDATDILESDLFGKNKEPFANLKESLTDYLRNKRKHFLKAYSDKLVDSYEADGVFPKFKPNEYDSGRKKDLRELIKALYEVEPKVFAQLNLEQKKTFVGLLNVLLDSGDRDRVLDIIKEVVDLEPKEQEEFVALLRVTKLNRIIRTIRLLSDRYEAVNLLKELVFNKELKADEVHDLQTAIESHYWLFGEEFHLVTAAEPNFEDALRALIYKTTGAVEDVVLESADKECEMDIFAIRQLVHTKEIESIVVELKHPKNITLGDKELLQVKKYSRVILSDDRFNGKNRTW